MTCSSYHDYGIINTTKYDASFFIILRSQSEKKKIDMVFKNIAEEYNSYSILI